MMQSHANAPLWSPCLSFEDYVGELPFFFASVLFAEIEFSCQI
jgi:hypothetical protein